ncbi:unnamed protein product [Lactuca saligna]|uniref:Uncharacterized protein n=1 Tax=Lactuca saligna TaxID=75948 RepID=A0AA35VRH0_LACSI|nr:unnamed protein product [Lactuca saligna]
MCNLKNRAPYPVGNHKSRPQLTDQNINGAKYRRSKPDLIDLNDGGHNNAGGGSPQNQQSRRIDISIFEIPVMVIGFIVDGRRLQHGVFFVGGVIGDETIGNGGGCGGVHHKWLKKVSDLTYRII